MRWTKGILWLFAAGSMLATYACLSNADPKFRQKVYRIGWQSDPPFQEQATDGSPSGMVIELVKDAARKRGIRLQWVWYPRGVDAALRSHDVDLWPLVTIIPERKSVVYISKPYFEHENVLLVRVDSPYHGRDDLTTARIGYYDLPINHRLLSSVLPQAELIGASTQKANIEALCAHRTEAAFLDEFTANSVLFSGLACISEPVRVISIAGVRTSLGVGATLESGPVADEIRRGLDDVAAEGGVDKVLSNLGQLSLGNLAYFSDLQNAGRRERWLLAALVIFGILLGLSLSAWYRIRIQKNRIAIAEGAFRESEQKLRLLANSLKEVVLAFDMQRNLVFSNPALERMTGYAAEEIQERRALCWVHPDDRERVAANWNSLFTGGSYRDLEYRMVTRDGELKWAIASWGPMLGEDGRQIGVYGTERDITKRKLAEQALRESERQFRELLEGVHLVAVVIDFEGVIRFCNDYAMTLTSWTRDQVIGRSAACFLDEDFLRRLRDESDGAGALPILEGTISTRTGKPRRIQWNSVGLRNSAGRPAGVACLGADITELETLRAESARRDGDNRLRSIADNGPLLIWVAAPRNTSAFFNKNWSDFTGRTTNPVFGDVWINSIHPAGVETYLNSYESEFAARESFHAKYRKQQQAGGYRWGLASAVPRFGPNREFDGYVGTFTDITELRRAHDEIIARQRLESVALLASGVAHEFNNLLGAVLAQADLAISDVAQDVSPLEPLQNVRTIALRGVRIARQLMIFAGREEAAPEELDLSSVVEESMDLLKVIVSKHTVLKADLARPLPAIYANSVQIRQVLMNLVINASEAIGESDGVITVRTESVTRRSDSLAEPLAGYVGLEVSDTGRGMTLDEQARVFDPFFTAKFPGHGLGLQVVKGIVRGLGGSIHFYTAVGKGSTFRLSFLATGRPPAVFPAAPSPNARRLMHHGLVLVVEDEPTLLLASAAILRRHGYSVLEAADGDAALSLIREHTSSIALLLLDVTLPGVPSRDVYTEARLARADMKIIVTSAYGQNAVDASLAGLDIDAFLRKPYKLAHLVELTGKLVSAEPTPEEKRFQPDGFWKTLAANPNS